MTEAALMKATLDLAHRLKWRIARFPAANYVRTKEGREFIRPLAHDTKGFPDCTLVRERLVMVELKQERGKLSEEQARWRKDLIGAGVEHHVWTPAQWLDGTIEKVLT